MSEGWKQGDEGYEASEGAVEWTVDVPGADPDMVASLTLDYWTGLGPRLKSSALNQFLFVGPLGTTSPAEVSVRMMRLPRNIQLHCRMVQPLTREVFSFGPAGWASPSREWCVAAVRAKQGFSDYLNDWLSSGR